MMSHPAVHCFSSRFTDIDALSLAKDTIHIGIGFEIPRSPTIDKPYKLGKDGLLFTLYLAIREDEHIKFYFVDAETGEMAFRGFQRDADAQQLSVAVEARHVALKNSEVNLTLETGTFLGSGRIPRHWDA